MSCAWLLNLDADLELQNPIGYAPRRAFLERTRSMAQSIVGLVRPGDSHIAPEAPRAPSGAQGRAWCPTPRALALIAAAGAAVPDAPPLAVLQRANHRRFSADLGQGLPGAGFVHTLDELQRRVHEPTATGYWMLKRPHGFSGLGHRRIPVGAFDHKSAPWVTASLKGDGIQVEPWVARTADFSMHGFVSREGDISIGEPCIQRCDERGAWLETTRASARELRAVEREALDAEARRSAVALAAAGYFGPFGLDAYRYVDADGEHFNPRSEINARYTMGWAIGMSTRPDV